MTIPTTAVDKLTKEQLKEIRLQMEQIIQNRGYYIQGVNDPAGRYAYTFGRNDRGEADLIMLNFNTVLAGLFEEALALIDLGEEGTGVSYTPGKVYESETLVCNTEPTQATKFKIVLTHPVIHKDKILGILSRGKALEEIKLLEIIVAGQNNLF
jgi:hypothetical protein